MSKDFWTTLKKAESAIDDVLHNRVKSVPKILKKRTWEIFSSERTYSR